MIVCRGEEPTDIDIDSYDSAMSFELIVVAALLALVDEGGALSADSLLKESCLLYTSPSPRDRTRSRMPSSA